MLMHQIPGDWRNANRPAEAVSKQERRLGPAKSPLHTGAEVADGFCRVQRAVVDPERSDFPLQGRADP